MLIKIKEIDMEKLKESLVDAKFSGSDKQGHLIYLSETLEEIPEDAFRIYERREPVGAGSWFEIDR